MNSARLVSPDIFHSGLQRRHFCSRYFCKIFLLMLNRWDVGCFVVIYGQACLACVISALSACGSEAGFGCFLGGGEKCGRPLVFKVFYKSHRSWPPSTTHCANRIGV